MRFSPLLGVSPYEAYQGWGSGPYNSQVLGLLSNTPKANPFADRKFTPMVLGDSPPWTPPTNTNTPDVPGWVAPVGTVVKGVNTAKNVGTVANSVRPGTSPIGTNIPGMLMGNANLGLLDAGAVGYNTLAGTGGWADLAAGPMQFGGGAGGAGSLGAFAGSLAGGLALMGGLHLWSGSGTGPPNSGLWSVNSRSGRLIEGGMSPEQANAQAITELLDASYTGGKDGLYFDESWGRNESRVSSVLELINNGVIAADSPLLNNWVDADVLTGNNKHLFEPGTVLGPDGSTYRQMFAGEGRPDSELHTVREKSDPTNFWNGEWVGEMLEGGPESLVPRLTPGITTGGGWSAGMGGYSFEYGNKDPWMDGLRNVERLYNNTTNPEYKAAAKEAITNFVNKDMEQFGFRFKSFPGSSLEKRLTKIAGV